jgi:hypothetical protein
VRDGGHGTNTQSVHRGNFEGVSLTGLDVLDLKDSVHGVRADTLVANIDSLASYLSIEHHLVTQ